MSETVTVTSQVPSGEPQVVKLSSPSHSAAPHKTRHVKFEHLIRPDLGNYCPASNLAFNEVIKTKIANGEKVYHLAFGQAPFPVMEGMVNALTDNAGQNAYLPVAGIPELREAIVSFHRRYDHLEGLHMDQIVVGPGTKELIFLLLTVFDGDVMVISPSWTTYKPQTHLARHHAAVIETTMEGHWKITPQLVEETIRANNLTKENKLLIMCNPDNPTGAAYTGTELAALSETFRKHKTVVLADEIYARLHYTQSHDTLARYYPEGTILSTGMSKWASAGGWRLGYHIYPPELKALRDAVRSAASHTYSCAPAPMQYAVAKALNHVEETDSYIKHTIRIMATVADYCTRALQSAGVEVIPSSAGYYIFPNFEILKPALAKRNIYTGEEFCRVLFEETKVALMSGGPAFLRPVEEFTTRLCYVNFDGKPALEESRRIGLGNPLPPDFVKNYAPLTYEGIQVLKAWLEKQLSDV